MKLVVLCFMGWVFLCSCVRRFWGKGEETDHRVFVRRKNSSYLVCYTVPLVHCSSGCLAVARAKMPRSSAFSSVFLAR